MSSSQTSPLSERDMSIRHAPCFHACATISTPFTFPPTLLRQAQVQADVEGSMQRMDAQLQREAKDAAKGLKAGFAGLEKEMDDKISEIK